MPGSPGAMLRRWSASDRLCCVRDGLQSPAPRGPSVPLLGVLLMLFIACGAGSDGVPYTGPLGPEAFDACALFPASEAAAEVPDREIGQLSGPLDASAGSEFARCAYGHGPGAILDAALEIRRYENPAAVRRNIEAALPMLKRLSGGDLAAVAGVGDLAWWAGGEVRMLKVGWRDLELTVTLQPGGGSGSPRAAAERIASRAVARLAGEPVPGELLPVPRTVSLGAAGEEPAREP